MITDSVLVEAAYTLGKHSGNCNLAPDGAAMFSRVFDLTVRAGIAVSPDQWASKKAGRSYVLEAVARMGQTAAELAGRGGDITEAIMRRAANTVVDQERQRLGIPMPERQAIVQSQFCFCYVISDLFE
jgi:hypothetical protein